MDDKCLSFEDMIEFLTSEKITDENRSQMFRINRHLIQCSNCGESYRRLAKMFDVVEGWSIPAQYEAEQKLQHMKICQALLRAKKTATPSLASRIEGWLANFVDSSAKISIMVHDSIKLAVDEACLFVKESARMDFRYVAASRSGSPKEDIGMMVDEDNEANSIKVDGKRAIQVSLDAISDSAPLVAVVPHDTALAATIVAPIYDKKQNLWIARIEGLKEGEYELIIEAAGGE